jgi:hypothetical protein
MTAGGLFWISGLPQIAKYALDSTNKLAYALTLAWRPFDFQVFLWGSAKPIPMGKETLWQC